jgi:hypothetical protein
MSSSSTVDARSASHDEFAPEAVWEDQAKVKVCSAVAPAEDFTFTFDFGEAWRTTRRSTSSTDPSRAGGSPAGR